MNTNQGPRGKPNITLLLNKHSNKMSSNILAVLVDQCLTLPSSSRPPAANKNKYEDPGQDYAESGRVWNTWL